MRVPALLTAISLAGLLTSFGLQPEWLFLALLCLISSFILLLTAWAHRRNQATNWIVLDGSNVMFWNGGEARIETVREVLVAVKAHGLRPAVVFDANAGYKLAGRYLNDRALAKLLNLPVNHVLIAPKGTPADPLILCAARDRDARILTNDRYRDWSDDYSDVLATALVTGNFKAGRLQLSL